MTRSPLITIGITCFNAEARILRAVKGALAQTWDNYEVLIVDDGSSDKSREILKELPSKFSNVRVILHKENRGFPSALNTLISEANGEFIAFFDDDDESNPGRLEQQYQRIMEYEAEHHNAVVFCYSNRDVIPLGEKSPSFVRYGIGRFPPEPKGPIVADFIMGLHRGDGYHCWGLFGSCTLMARVKSFQCNQGFDIDFRRCAELEFAVRAAFKGAHFISVNYSLITQHMTSGNHKAGDADLRFRLNLLKKHKVYLKEKSSYIGAFANMRAWYAFTCGKNVKGYCWRVIALFCYPIKVAVSWRKLNS